MTVANRPSSTGTFERRTAEADRIVIGAFTLLILPAIPSGVALLAVGGYGRRELFPHSDIDLLLLLETERAAGAASEPISDFLRELWDTRLRISQSVRTTQECCELHDRNVELNISLLDHRFLAGDEGLYAKLTSRLPRFLSASRGALVRNLSRITRERHAKFQNTIYHLEPNVKESPGGLRDYQLLRWLAQIRGGNTPELAEAREFLFNVRERLHEMANRDANVLTFEAQDSLSGNLGLTASGTMREYYRHTRVIHGTCMRTLEACEAQASSLYTQFRDWRSRLGNAEISVARERIFFRSRQQLDADPELALRLFEFAARHNMRLAVETEQKIALQLPYLRVYFSHPRPIWPAIRAILSLPHAPVALRAMQETGVLGAIFPELDGIDCLVVRDFYHRYTVDEHTLVAIQNLFDIRERRFADLYSEVDQHPLVLFALLFHDAGKAAQGDHVKASAALAEAAMARIGIPQRELVRFLIRNHLELSGVMTSRDLDDPQTARELARGMETVERLKALTLLTYADISAVFPGALTPWRAEQLWRVYLTAYRELTRELETERIHLGSDDSPDRREFLEGLPVRYLRTHTTEHIDSDMRLERRSHERGVAVDVSKAAGGWQLSVVATDRPGLFAAVAGTLAGFGMNILKADAFANLRGTTVNKFRFADPLRGLELNPTEIDRLKNCVERVVLGKLQVQELLRNRPEPRRPAATAHVSPRVSFDSEASGAATLIEIVAEDRPGLLYDLASAITRKGCSIEVVLIDTQAHKAIDVFYVTAGGLKLDADGIAKLRVELLRVCGGR